MELTKEMIEQNKNQKTDYLIKVETEGLDEAIKKTRELTELLREANELANTLSDSLPNT